MNYPRPLEMILAYNTPHYMPVEAVLQGLSQLDPRFKPLRVEASNSKAQNIKEGGEYFIVYLVGMVKTVCRARLP